MVLISDKVGSDIDRAILSYCGAKSLCNLSILNKLSLSEQTQKLIDNQWKVLIDQRWRLKATAIRNVGAPSWKVAYQILSMRKTIPRGIFTEKFNTIFGRGRTFGCSSWILVSHRPNTTLRRVVVQGGECTIIDLRLCVQNICSGFIAIDASKHSSFEVTYRSEDGSLHRAPVLDTRVIALNGKRIEGEKRALIELGQLDFTVIAMSVACPLDMEFETDFLTRAEQLTVTATSCLPSQVAKGRGDIPIVNNFVDEDTVWESYIELPGGAILLREDCGRGEAM
jgi:hypothetical protein